MKITEYIGLAPQTIVSLSTLRHVKAVRLSLLVLKHICISAVDLQKELCVSSLELKKIVDMATQGHLVQTYVTAKRENWYVPHDSVISVCDCRSCKYVKINFDGGFEKIECRLRKTCMMDTYRLARSMVAYLKFRGCTKAVHVANLRNIKVIETGASDLPVDEWKTEDFARFLRACYNKNWSHMGALSLAQAQRTCIRLKKAFMVEFASRWRYTLKNYIRYSINRVLEKGKCLNLELMCKKEIMQQFVDAKKFYLHQKCKTHSIYCPYWDGGCSLTSQVCDSAFLDNIKKVYN